ncbi:hypothetical protein BRC86_01160 [Halobacteriales archaeon QS_3_64_16]|nr:MAG: hypothetical protein BRC86_01160 [Halobacteriales archaeon QS_3_64_16]
MAALFVIYSVAAIDLLFRFVGAPLTSFTYTAKISSVGLPIELTTVIALLISGFGFYVFMTGMLRYKILYVQYIITDSLALRNSEGANSRDP